MGGINDIRYQALSLYKYSSSEIQAAFPLKLYTGSGECSRINMRYNNDQMYSFRITSVDYQNDRMTIKANKPLQTRGNYNQSRVQLQFTNSNTGLKFSDQYESLWKSLNKTVHISTNSGKSIDAAINYQDVSNTLYAVNYNRDNPQDFISQINKAADTEFTFIFIFMG